jgi:diacylglycerol O-acyltransferase / wax synthase
MKRLSGLDASFLHLETPEMPMHVGALHVFELPKGFRGKFVTALRAHMAARLPLAPALRRRLWMMPMNLSNPVWVDAVPDMRYHVVEVEVPKVSKAKGGKGLMLADLEALVGRMHNHLLDRDKPLWRFHVIEGLQSGSDGRKRVAMYTQLHHAAVDGQAAVALANAILDLSAEGRDVQAKPSSRPKRFELSLVEMISGAVTSEVQQITQLIRALPSAVGSLSSAATQAAARSSLVTGRKKAGALSRAPRMALNAAVTQQRAFAAITLPLMECKAIGKRHEATLNDVVLWLCSTALRTHYQRRGNLPKTSLVAAVPVSLRAKGDTSANNQASMTLFSLGTHVADDVKRLAHIKAASKSMKKTLAGVKSILPTDFPSLGVPWLMEAATALYHRATANDVLPPVANLAISNVPGPPVPLYMAGAKMLTNYPCSIVTHGLALNITVQSYDQSLDFGLMADAKAMPDVRRFGQGLIEAMEVLRELPVDDPDAPPVRTSVRTPVRRATRETAVARKASRTRASRASR